MFGQLTVTVDDDYYLGASVLLGDYDLEGGIELGTKLDYFTFDLTPEYYSQSNTWWNNYDNWGAWLWDTLDKLPGLIDGLPGDHTTWGWWNAFDSVSATVVRVSGSPLVSSFACLLSVCDTCRRVGSASYGASDTLPYRFRYYARMTWEMMCDGLWV